MEQWFHKIPEKEMIAWRRHIHQNPELSFKEYNTAAFIIEKLQSFGNITIERPSETGVLGILKGGKEGKTILLRADMDALPMQEESGLTFQSSLKDVAHTCGHDAHVAILLATASVLSGMQSDLQGTVKFIFQPGEEKDPGGALAVVNSGMIDDVDAVLGLHVFPNLPCGTIHVTPQGPATCAADGFFLHIQGKGSHGSMPQRGIDPIIVGTQIINQLQTIISRYVTPGEMNVLSIGEFKAGDAPNIIPDKAYMSASIRTIDENTRQRIAKRVKVIIDNTCNMYGASYDLNYVFSYPSVINDQQITKLVMDSAAQVLGNDKVYELALSSGSEDFANYRKVAPICWFQLGCGTAQEGCGFINHHPKFMIKEDAFIAGVKTEVQSVLNFLKTTGSVK